MNEYIEAVLETFNGGNWRCAGKWKGDRSVVETATFAREMLTDDRYHLKARVKVRTVKEWEI